MMGLCAPQAPLHAAVPSRSDHKQPGAGPMSGDRRARPRQRGRQGTGIRSWPRLTGALAGGDCRAQDPRRTWSPAVRRRLRMCQGPALLREAPPRTDPTARELPHAVSERRADPPRHLPSKGSPRLSRSYAPINAPPRPLPSANDPLSSAFSREQPPAWNFLLGKP